MSRPDDDRPQFSRREALQAAIAASAALAVAPAEGQARRPGARLHEGPRRSLHRRARRRPAGLTPDAAVLTTDSGLAQLRRAEEAGARRGAS